MNTLNLIISGWYFFPVLFTALGLAWSFWRDDPPLVVLRRLLLVLLTSNVVWAVAGFLK